MLVILLKSCLTMAILKVKLLAKGKVYLSAIIAKKAVKTHKDDWKDYQDAVKKIALKNLNLVTDVTKST